MGWFERVTSAVTSRFRNENIRTLTVEEWAQRVWQSGGISTSSGAFVGPETALRLAAVMSCVRVLSETVAMLPLVLYRKDKSGGWSEATDHPLFEVLGVQANDWNTSFELREGSMANLALRGNAYAYVQRNRTGQPIALIPLHPDGVMIEMANDYSPIYTVTFPDGQRRQVGPGEIHHVRGPLPLGFMGRSMVTLAREGIGLGLAAEEFGARLFRNGVNASGVLTHPKNLSKPAQDRLIEQIATRHQGLENAHKPFIMEEGMTWTQISMTPDDAQFIETRKMQRTEICGIFRVPPHMIADLERATFSNIEHQGIDFVVHSIMPWLVRWEQAITRDLLLPSERATYRASFVTDELLRGDIKSRNEAFGLRIQNGINSPNEIRAIDKLPPRPGGDEFWRPVNMGGAPAPGTGPAQPGGQPTPAKQ